ncbi:putative F-box protein At1g53550 [Fagus crenata]
MEGGRSFDSLPEDIIRHIFLRRNVPPIYCVLRLVCKTWYVLITDLTNVLLKRLRATSLGIISLRADSNSDETISSCKLYSLQRRGGLKSLMTMTIPNIDPLYTPSHLKFLPSINGLICLTNNNHFLICNPTTTEFVSLPICRPRLLPDMLRVHCDTGFGYCPSKNQYKVVKIFEVYYKDKPFSMLKTLVITLGPSNSWRIIENPPHKTFGKSIYLNGTIYWTTFSDDYHSLLYITAFDVGDETFRIINVPQDISRYTSDMEEHEGRLCLMHYIPKPKEGIEIYMMVEDQQWVLRYTVLYEDFNPHYVEDLPAFCFSCLKKGKIIIGSDFTDEWLLYDIESKAFESVEFGESDLSFPCVSPFEVSFTPIICRC